MTAPLLVIVIALESAHAFAKPLVHMTRTIWGCVDPNVAPEINDPQNPRGQDTAWMVQAATDGQCVMISSHSVWEPLSDSHNGLTYVAYRGTTGKPGSFWVPTDALALATPILLKPQPAPHSVAPQPAVTPRPMPAPEPVPAPQVQADTNADAKAQAPPQTPPTPEPTLTPSPPEQPTAGGDGSGGGVIALLILLGLGWLVHRSRKRGKVARANSRPAERKPRTPVTAKSANLPSVPNVARQAARSLSPTSGPSATRHAHAVPAGPSGPLRFSGGGRSDPGPSPVTGVPSGSSTPASAPMWRAPGTAVTVCGLTVRDGMVYVGRPGRRSDGQDPSLIDPTLPVAGNAASAEPLGYWPSYAGIGPDCRRRYLEWLASGKQEPNTDIGYVFIYFYGLERRLVLEAPDRAEARALLTELHRLRSIYAGSGSFDGYSRRLVDVATYLLDPAGAAATVGDQDLSTMRGEMPLALTVAIAREVVQNRPLGFEHASAVLFGLREFSQDLRSLRDVGRSAFLKVLQARFAIAFPDGYPVHNRKDSHLRLYYRGAAAGLQADLTARAGLERLPDPATLTWTKLVAFGSAVAQEVAPYAKAMKYHPTMANSLLGLATCPPELRDSVAVEARRWLEALPGPVAAAPFGELARHAIGATGAKWSMRQHQHIADALAGAGYAFEPGLEDGKVHFEDDSPVQVFRCGSDTRSRTMSVASAAAVLVAAVAKTVDGAYAAAAGRWLAAVPSRLTLSPDQLTRLGAQLAYLATRSVTVPKAKRMLGEATPEERGFCAWSASEAASATGDVGKPQIAVLEGIYDALSIPRGTLYAGLHADIGAAAAEAHDPVLVSDEVVEALHPIRRPPSAPPMKADAEDRLARIRAETERVSAMLADIFVEDEAPQQAHDAVPEGRFAGLDAEHADLLGHLLTRPEWSRADFDAAASQAGLMPGGAMETINEWAFDHFRDALLEDADPMVVNQALLPEDAESVPAE